MQRHASTLSFFLAAVLAFISATTVRADEVTDWNQILFQAFIVDNTPQVNFTRSAAIVQASVFDAVNGIERRYTPVHVVPDAPRGASARAAAVQAAYASLVKIYPAQQATFDAAREASLAAILDAKAGWHEQERRQRAIDLGVQWGQQVADAIWAWRSTDGFDPPPAPVLGGTGVGEWRPTPPGFLSGRGYSLSYSTPWVIVSPSQFRPSGPPALTSARYAEVFNESKVYGSASSVVRTADQTVYSIFWQGAVNRAWSRVAIELGAERHTTLLQNALILGELNVALADATIAGFDAKYHFNFWRPVTAIQLADTDGNPATAVDSSWTPLIVTPPHPDYVSTHSALTAAAIAVLSHYFGRHSSFVVDSEFSPGVVRSFDDFPSAQVELNNARVYGGIHFRTACEDGETLGAAVGRFVLRNSFQRVDGHDEFPAPDSGTVPHPISSPRPHGLFSARPQDRMTGPIPLD